MFAMVSKVNTFWLIFWFFSIQTIHAAEINDKNKDKSNINYSFSVKDHNIIRYTFSVEEWVVSTSVKVQIEVHATLQAKDIAAKREEVLKKLNEAAPASWNFTIISLAKNEANLEEVYMQVEARIPQKDIGNIHAKVDGLSQPGTKYNVQFVDFDPSLDELEVVYQKLRSRIYEQVKQEIDRLQKLYPEEHFYLQSLNIGDKSPIQPMMFKGASAVRAMTAEIGVAPHSDNVTNASVKTKLVLPAMVQIGTENTKLHSN